MAGRLAGKVAIVTGAGSRGPGVGNGKATATLFAREGARVLCVDRVVERAQETVDTIVAEGNEAFAFAADAATADGCGAMVEEAVRRWGGLHVLHNNVGIESRSGLMNIPEDEWDRVLAVDLKSMMLGTRAAVPHFRAGGGGVVLNVASVAGLRALEPPRTAYAAAKAGAIGLTLSMAGELAPERIRVNCIAPGYVYTPMVQSLGMTPEIREQRRRAGLLPDEGTAWDVGWAAVFLASDEARWITGHVLVVDGGLTAAVRTGL